MTIRQQSDQAIIHWEDFSIGDGEKVSFHLPSDASKTLNGVVGHTLSEINGQLNSNGTIYLINQNGILIDPNGLIQTNSFVGSTLDLSNEDFLSNAQKLYSLSGHRLKIIGG